MNKNPGQVLQTKILIVTAVFALISYLLAAPLTGLGISPAIYAAIAVVLCGAALTIVVTMSLPTSQRRNNVKTLYVGNLPYRANEATVKTLFSAHGQVYTVRLMKDRQTGKRKGYGFVEVAAADAEKAIEALNESEFQQRTLKVREARERKQDMLL